MSIWVPPRDDGTHSNGTGYHTGTAAVLGTTGISYLQQQHSCSPSRPRAKRMHVGSRARQNSRRGRLIDTIIITYCSRLLVLTENVIYLIYDPQPPSLLCRRTHCDCCLLYNTLTDDALSHPAALATATGCVYQNVTAVLHKTQGTSINNKQDFLLENAVGAFSTLTSV